MFNKQDPLQEIISIVENNQLTVKEVVTALTETHAISAQKSNSLLARLFGYIGSILIFAGICIFIGMQWDQFSSGSKIAVTLGTGFATLLLALVAINHSKFNYSATPLLLMAALFQPMGIFVMLDEFSQGSDPLYGFLFMSMVMLIQQGAILWQTKHTTLAFTTIFFVSSFFITAMALLKINGNLISLTIGISLMCISWALSNSPHRSIAGFWYLIGSIALLVATFDLLQDTPFEVFFLGLTTLIIYISTATRSRILLFVGTLSMLAYISHFTYEHYSHTLGWPLVLMFCGITIITVGAIAMKINNRYIRKTIFQETIISV